MKSICLSLCCLLFVASVGLAQDDGFVPLFDGKSLEGWSSARSSGEGDWGPFSVNKEEQAIHVYAGKEANSKQNSDCLNTDTEYSHFILKLEYKWGENRFEPRADWDRDAGLLFHVHGNLTRVWPFSLEMQIGESAKDKPRGKDNQGRFHTGDLFVLRKDLRTTTLQKNRAYAADGEPKVGRNVQTMLGVEKPKGEWNEIELRVDGSEKATFILNGEVVLETMDFQFKDKDGNKVALDRGHIGFQAEWAELMYRNIRIKDLSAEATCKTLIKQIKNNCIAYKLLVGSYPRSLKDLVTPPKGMSVGEWGGPYFRDGKLPKDPWGNDFIYSADEAQDRVFVSSNGPDATQGTADDCPAEKKE